MLNYICDFPQEHGLGCHNQQANGQETLEHRAQKSSTKSVLNEILSKIVRI